MVNVEKIYPMGEFFHMRNVDTNHSHSHNLRFLVAKSAFLQFTRFIAKFVFSDLFAFAWRKVETNNCVCGEKGQIRGMLSYFVCKNVKHVIGIVRYDGFVCMV